MRALLGIGASLHVLAAGALADAPRDLIDQGNADFAAGRYAEALEKYDAIDEGAAGPFTAELLHNRAATQFKLGNLDEARELWVRAAALKDAAFEARARYNLGNCNYAEALAMMETQPAPDGGGGPDLGAVFESLDRATEHYVDALRLDPTLADARANLELAQLLKKQLEEQATTQPSSQSQQGQPSSQPSTDQQQGQDQQQGDQQQPQSQPSSQSSTDQDQSQQQQPESQPAEQEPQSQPAQADSQPAEQPELEPQPADEQPQPDETRPAVPIEMTPEEAARLLQKVRDMQAARRRALARREAAGHQPVERDW